MKFIEGELNPDLLEILNEYSDWFFNFDRSLLSKNGEPDENEYHTSLEYLDEVDKDTHVGFPEHTYGLDLMDIHCLDPLHPLFREFRQKVVDTDGKMLRFFGARFSAVKMYYPTNGFMGWHNNWNCPGENLLLSYTKTGNGWFRYRDPITKEIVTMDDKPGWTAKVGYYGRKDEPDKIYWHCARAYEERLTLGFVIPDKQMWDMMVEDLVA